MKMEEICRDSFGDIKEILGEKTNNEVKGVIEGNPGWIFVDDPKKPRAALVYARGMKGFYLVGHSQGLKLKPFLEKVIIPRLKEQGLRWFEVSGDRNDWDAVIEEIFQDRDVSSFTQYVYLSTGIIRELKTSIEEGYELKKIDREILGYGGLVKEILQFWDSYDDYLARGYGYCIPYRGEVVSLIYSSFVAGNVHTVGVETKKEHQKKGLGLLVSHALLLDLIKQGMVMYWDCSKSNVASWHLAERLGLSRTWQYQVYEFALWEE